MVLSLSAPTPAPASAVEALWMLAGRVGKAFRSLRRDAWRLDCSGEFPEVVATLARLLQQLGHELQPQRPLDLGRARPEALDLVEVLVMVADSHGLEVPASIGSHGIQQQKAPENHDLAHQPAPVPVHDSC